MTQPAHCRSRYQCGRQTAGYPARPGQRRTRRTYNCCRGQNEKPHRGQLQVTGGHLDSRGDQRRLVIIVDCPPDDLPGGAVDDRREKRPSFPRRNVRNIAHHLLARCLRGEVAVHQVRDRPGLPLDGGGGAPGRRLAVHQSQLAHDLADQPGAGGDARAGQLRGDPPVPVGAVGVLEYVPDQRGEVLAASRGGALRPAPPFIETGLRYFQPFAHARYTRSGLAGGVLRIDELIHVAYRCSAAKYAAAFERNSAFILSSRFSRSSSRSRARSDSCSGGSSSACFSRYARTQLPRLVSLIPSSRATSAIGRDVSMTIRAASSRNSGEKFLYFFGTRSRPFQ